MFRIINKLKNRKGFTLIELIVVLAVLAIIMAIAVPRFLGVQEDAREDADYSTGAMIAKAAELYYAKTETTADVSAQDLIDDNYINGIEFQSSDFDGVDLDTEVTVSTSGSTITVTIVNDGGTTETLYPRP
ncbi:MAG: type II secretion system protein [Sedimentibacter sp.]|uniref:competence type IV pilus major pilin ComGC n=1 Tax=Sedimentibacter sp. TaxID=1960295 RepID=UPI00298277BE|nr:type II secretion system protein [Sedimentibacter sp.]MDW5300405.1 type II secretion system protein [Sedimentibacter sp.]